MTDVTDHRDLGAFIPAVLDDYPLDPFEFRVYARIVRRAGGPRGHDESAANVAKAIGCGARKVREAYDLLTAAKLVHRTKRPGRSDRFTLRPSSEWVSPAQLAALRAAATRPDRRTDDAADTCGKADDTAVGPTAVPPTAVGEAGQAGRSDPATAVGPTYEGTPLRFSQKDHHPARDADTDVAVDKPNDGGGGSADAEDPRPSTFAATDAVIDEAGGVPEDLSPALAAIAVRLDELPRRRLLGEPADRLHRLEVVLHARVVDGWDPEELAAVVTDGSLAGAALVTAVLASRAQQLAGVDPPQARRRDADGIPPDVLAALERRAADDAVLLDGSVDAELRRRRLDEHIRLWLEQHQEQEVGAR